MDARSSQPRERNRVHTIDTDTAIVEKPVVKAPAKKRAKVVKEYAPHEHFGSPLNVCRICGEKYTYVQKPHGFTLGKQ